MSDYPFTLEGIEWTTPVSGLPDTTVVYLSQHLVEANEIDELKWKHAINAQLISKYGQPAIDFGYGPTGLGEFEEFVTEISSVTSLGGFHSPGDDVLVFVSGADDDGVLAVELLEEAIGEADDGDCYTLTADARGTYTLTVTSHDGLENLAGALSDKWMIHTDETGDDFGEHEEPRERSIRTRGDAFRISKIVWASPDADLPTEACVVLPDWLVCAERNVAGCEWNREINDQLQAKFGFRARSFEFAPSMTFGCEHLDVG